MPLLSGLLYSLSYDDLKSIKHSKSYQAQHKQPDKRHLFGYTVIKLEEDVTFHVGWRPDDLEGKPSEKGRIPRPMPDSTAEYREILGRTQEDLSRFPKQILNRKVEALHGS